MKVILLQRSAWYGHVAKYFAQNIEDVLARRVRTFFWMLVLPEDSPKAASVLVG